MSTIQTSKHSNNQHEREFLPVNAGWDSFDKMFSNVRSHWPFQVSGPTPFKSHEMILNPNVDIKEGKKAYEITAELPGIDTKDINVEVSGNVLTISGDKRTEKSSNDNNDYHVMERHYGFFKRTFTLPNGVVKDKVSADFKNGVLHISLPKSEKALQEQHKIPIKG